MSGKTPLLNNEDWAKKVSERLLEKLKGLGTEPPDDLIEIVADKRNTVLHCIAELQQGHGIDKNTKFIHSAFRNLPEIGLSQSVSDALLSLGKKHNDLKKEFNAISTHQKADPYEALGKIQSWKLSLGVHTAMLAGLATYSAFHKGCETPAKQGHPNGVPTAPADALPKTPSAEALEKNGKHVERLNRNQSSNILMPRS